MRRLIFGKTNTRHAPFPDDYERPAGCLEYEHTSNGQRFLFYRPIKACHCISGRCREQNHSYSQRDVITGMMRSLGHHESFILRCKSEGVIY